MLCGIIIILSMIFWIKRDSSLFPFNLSYSPIIMIKWLLNAFKLDKTAYMSSLILEGIRSKSSTTIINFCFLVLNFLVTEDSYHPSFMALSWKTVTIDVKINSGANKFQLTGLENIQFIKLFNRKNRATTIGASQFRIILILGYRLVKI